jgi:hypothetical protein
MTLKGFTSVVVGLSVAVVIAACSPASDRDGGGGAPGSTSIATGSPTIGPTPSTSVIDGPSVAPREEPVAAVLVPSDGVLPRALSYGVVLWTIRDAVITNQDPKRYEPGVPARPTKTTSLIIDLDERNDNVVVGVIADNARFEVGLPGGATVRGKNIAGVSVPPVSSATGRYAFEVPEGTGFEGLVLTIADPGREPSVDLPFDGPPPAVETNRTVRLDKATKLKIPNIDMTWTIESVIIGHDWPLPLGFKGGTLPAGTRAETGHRWLGIVASVRVGSCGCRGGVLDQAGSARLFVDGVPISASAALSSNAILVAQTVSDVLLVFAVPADAPNAALQVGPLDTPAEQGTFALDLD